MSLRVLTGIKPTGIPHLGNYVGAIRPAVVASVAPDVESFFFLADYHALISTQDPLRVQRSTLEIAASWIACGLDPERVAFYRQSDIPETTELTWLLTCVAGKGLLNRAHAYKAAVDRNRAEGSDDDAGVTAGLYMYPVLMAADILLFNAHKVPVGRDQVQHIEMARDFAQRFNHLYGPHFTLPEAAVEEQVATLPGLDGRKMSKSYDNVIPLFAPREQLRKLVLSIVTDSRAPGEPKDTAGSAVFQLYQAFAGADDTGAMRRAFADGIAWGDAKEQLVERIDTELAPMRERYEALVADPAGIERMLRLGGERLRDERARPLLARLRDAVGLRDLGAGGGGIATPSPAAEGAARPAPPVFKQYREADGRFHFKLVDGERLLLQGAGFESPRDCGRVVAALKSGTAAHRIDADGQVLLDGAIVGALGEGVDAAALVQALARIGEGDE
ncbi:tryptophan--tRNA ligase [Luteimonas sp. MJ246]|uniref:tryptophan--tRNA ligase n=1 Tax=Luteimonas sp. MJ174 TaxID=3129237 RepID=UPI0031BB18EB